MSDVGFIHFVYPLRHSRMDAVQNVKEKMKLLEIQQILSSKILQYSNNVIHILTAYAYPNINCS